MGAIPWKPSAGYPALQARARLLASLRAFFADRGVLEVETPVIARGAATDPNLASLSSMLHGRKRMFLQTSPEFAMKRLLAAGSGDIFQVCKVFRDGESGPLHNPEFTLLEWYRLDTGMHALIKEVAELLDLLLGGRPGLAADARCVSYREIFLSEVGTDPLTSDERSLAEALQGLGVALPDGPLHKDALLDLAMSTLVLPALPPDTLTFVTHYPASQASLARLDPGDPRTALRFEAMLGGMELCNGFEELQDADQQRLRFENDRRFRRAAGLPEVPIDERLLEALRAGLPACSGVALGLDRVLMIALAAAHIEEVIAFPVECA